MTNKSKQKKSANSSAETAPDAEVAPSDRTRVLCSIILDRLKKQDVVWVRIADPVAKLVDDLQIATKTRVDAYLIQWSEWPDTLALQDLTTERGDEASLIKQLADGWKRLKKQYRLPVAVHLLTNDQPSSKKIDGTPKNDCHLAKFLASEWKQNKQGDAAWATVWAEIRKASGLTEKQFDDFVQNCKFDCSYARPELDEEGDDFQPYHWVEHIYDTLFEHEEHSTLPIELNQAELLQILGWRRDQSRQLLKLPKGEPTFADVAEQAQAQTTPVKPQEEPIDSAALSSIRGAAAAGWLQAAGDSQGEVADWLRTGSDSTTAQPANVSAEKLQPLDLDSTPSEDNAGKRPLSPFVGSKQGKEKKSWKDLAEGERQTPGPRRFNEPSENRSADADSQRVTAKLRQMLSARVPEPGQEDDESEELVEGESALDHDAREPHEEHDSEYTEEAEPESVSKESSSDDDDSDSGEFARAIEAADSKELSEAEPVTDETTTAATAQSEKAFSSEELDALGFGHMHSSEETNKTPVSASHETTSAAQTATEPDPAALDFSPLNEQPDDETAHSDEEALDDHDDADTFTKISRLARKQDGHGTAEDAASLDAFNWYFNNGNELFEASRFEDAALEYFRALELVSNLDGPHQDQEFLILQNLGDIYMFLDKPEQAVELYERTIEQRFSTRIPAAKYIAALIKLGSYYEDKNCFADAEKEYRKAVEVAAEFLEKDDPILVRLNDACLNLARNRATLLSRFSSTEVERIREMAKQEVDVAIMYRKKKTTEADLEIVDIWKGGRKPDQEDEPPPPPSSKSLWIFASATVVVLFVFAFAIFVPQNGTVAPGGEQTVGSYTSADGQKVIALEQDGKAKYNYNGKEQIASYSFIGDTIQDLIPLVPGHLRTSYTFFDSKDSAIVDSSGTYFYADDAPELKLVKQMWRYAELAQGYRHEKHFYPESDDAWSISKDKLTFTNPITDKDDQAVIFSTTGEATDTPVRTSIVDGEAWKGQPESSPGRILCNVYNGRMFFIRGFDRNNKLLTSADKRKCFYIECSDGVDVTKDKLKFLAQGIDTPDAGAPDAEAAKPDKKLQFIFAATPEVEARFLFLLSAVPGALFCLVLVSLGIWRYRVNKKVAGPVSIGFCVLTTLLLIGWYVIGIMDIT